MVRKLLRVTGYAGLAVSIAGCYLSQHAATADLAKAGVALFALGLWCGCIALVLGTNPKP